MDINLRSKSLWQEQDAKMFHFYCPVCSSARKTSMHPQPYQPVLLFRVFVTSLVVTLSLWNWMEWKGIVSFIPLWIGFEIIYRTKVRMQLECPHCGFDPFLYLSRPEAANARVKHHFRKLYDEKGIPFPTASESVAATKRRASKSPRASLDL